MHKVRTPDFKHPAVQVDHGPGAIELIGIFVLQMAAGNSVPAKDTESCGNTWQKVQGVENCLAQGIGIGVTRGLAK